MGEIRNQLKSQNLGALLPTSIEQVGSAVFPDGATLEDQMDFTQIIQAWSSVHNPTFGSPIGSTGAKNSVTGAETLLSVSKSVVAQIQVIEFANAGGAAPVVVSLTWNGVKLPLTSQGEVELAIAPSGTASVPFTKELYVDVNSPLAVLVASGTGSDLTSTVGYLQTSQ